MHHVLKGASKTAWGGGSRGLTKITTLNSGNSGGFHIGCQQEEHEGGSWVTALEVEGGVRG